MREHMNALNEGRFDTDARFIVDRMVRKAVTDAVKEGSVEGSQKYTSVDGKPIVITARFLNAQVSTQWTLDGTPLTIDEAVAAVAARMQSRLG